MRNGAALAGIEKAVEPMRHALFGSLVWTRCQDAQIAIELLAVGVDDGAAQGVGQRQGQRRFAARGRTGDDEDGRRAVPA